MPVQGLPVRFAGPFGNSHRPVLDSISLGKKSWKGAELVPSEMVSLRRTEVQVFLVMICLQVVIQGTGISGRCEMWSVLEDCSGARPISGT